MSGAASATAITASTIGMTAGEAALATSAAASATAAGAASAFSLSSVATAATIGSTAISALGSIQQSRANSAAAGYNAKVAAQNAELQTKNANFAGAKGEQDVAAEGAKNKAALAATLAAQGASGVDVNSESSVNTRQSEAKIGALNALTVRSNAAKEAYGYQVGASSEAAQEKLLKKQASYDTTGGYLNAGATVLGGISSASKYTDWLNNNGLTP